MAIITAIYFWFKWTRHDCYTIFYYSKSLQCLSGRTETMHAKHITTVLGQINRQTSTVRMCSNIDKGWWAAARFCRACACFFVFSLAMLMLIHIQITSFALLIPIVDMSFYRYAYPAGIWYGFHVISMGRFIIVTYICFCVYCNFRIRSNI